MVAVLSTGALATNYGSNVDVSATQVQSTHVESTNVNQSKSTAGAQSTAGSLSTSQGGDSSSRSTAKVGDVNTAGGAGGASTAYGGTSKATVGDTQATVGNTNAAIGDTSTGDVASNVSITDARVSSTEFRQAAQSAATVFASVCQNGASAQGMEAGFSVINQDVMCDELQLAAILRDAYMFELEMGRTEKANEYLAEYYTSMSSAIGLMRNTKKAGLLDKFSGYLVRPMALIGALIWLI